MATSTTILRRIATFLAVVAGLSAILDALLISAGTIDAAGSLAAFITMWMPAIAALVICRCRIYRERIGLPISCPSPTRPPPTLVLALHSGSLTLLERRSRHRFAVEALHASFFGRRAIQRLDAPFARP